MRFPSLKRLSMPLSLTVYFLFDSRWLLDSETGNASISQRVPRPHLWKQNVRKRLRQTGQAYVNANGMVQLGRTVRDTCPSQCIYRCQSKFNEIDRVELHRLFWSLPDSEKLAFYEKFTTRRCAARKRTKSQHSRRTFSYIYFFDTGEGKREQVCQKFFLSTLDISKGRVYHYFKTKNEMEASSIASAATDGGPIKKRRRRGRLNDGTISASRMDT